jgi:sec-independent protein translocase protein TatC
MQLILIKLQEGFFVADPISMLGGFVLAFPVIAYQMWRFVAPGLYRSEKNAFLPFLIASPVMFLLGAAFAFYVVTAAGLRLLPGFQQPGRCSATAGEGGRARWRWRASPSRARWRNTCR